MPNANQLPAHIRQLVDKKNYVIAIKTHAQEQGISMDEAKNQIDAYEQTQLPQGSQTGGLNQLSQSLDQHLQQEQIKVPLMPRWVWRIAVIISVMVVIGWMIYRLFIH